MTCKEIYNYHTSGAEETVILEAYQDVPLESRDEIHDNNTVTFRLQAPKAVKVQVTGDFLPKQKIKTANGEFEILGIAELTEGKTGVWEYTTPEPLQPELSLSPFDQGITDSFGNVLKRLGRVLIVWEKPLSGRINWYKTAAK